MDYNEESLITVLRRDNFCLMTNGDGKELYNAEGNLLVCKAENGECMSIPNTETFRKLYDLPVHCKGIQKRTEAENTGEIGRECILNTEALKQLNDLPFQCDGIQKKTEAENNRSTGQSFSVFKPKKIREPTPDTDETLIHPINSESCQQLLKGSEKRVQIREKICKEMESKGFYRYRKTPLDKRQKVFKMLRNKKNFMKHKIKKNYVIDSKNPVTNELIKNTIFKELINSHQYLQKIENKPCDNIFSHSLGHDGQKIEELEVSNLPCILSPDPDVSMETNMAAISPIPASNNQPVCSKPIPTSSSTHNHSQEKILEVLSQIKSIQETTLTTQQQNLSNIISLLEELVKQQKSLHLVFTQFVTNYSKKSKNYYVTKNNHKL